MNKNIKVNKMAEYNKGKGKRAEKTSKIGVVAFSKGNNQSALISQIKTSQEIYLEYRHHIAIGKDRRNKNTRKARRDFYNKQWIDLSEHKKLKALYDDLLQNFKRMDKNTITKSEHEMIVKNYEKESKQDLKTISKISKSLDYKDAEIESLKDDVLCNEYWVLDSKKDLEKKDAEIRNLKEQVLKLKEKLKKRKMAV